MVIRLLFLLAIAGFSSTASASVNFYSSVLAASNACQSAWGNGTCQQTFYPTSANCPAVSYDLVSYKSPSSHYIYCTGTPTCPTGQTYNSGLGTCVAPTSTPVPSTPTPTPVPKANPAACPPNTTATLTNGVQTCNLNQQDSCAGYTSIKADPVSGICKSPTLPVSPTCSGGSINAVDWSGTEKCVSPSVCTAPSVIGTTSNGSQFCQLTPTTNGAKNSDGSAVPDTSQAASQATSSASTAQTAATQAAQAVTDRTTAAQTAVTQATQAETAAQQAAATGTTSASAIAAQQAAATASAWAATAQQQAANAATQSTIAQTNATAATNAATDAAIAEAKAAAASAYEAAQLAATAAQNASNARNGAQAGANPTGQGSGTGTQNTNCPDCAKESTQQGIKNDTDQIAADIGAIKDGIGKGSGTDPTPGTRKVGDSLKDLGDGMRQRFATTTFSMPGADCPVFTQQIPFINTTLTIDQFCTLAPTIEPIVGTAANVMWLIIAFTVLMGA